MISPLRAAQKTALSPGFGRLYWKASYFLLFVNQTIVFFFNCFRYFYTILMWVSSKLYGEGRICFHIKIFFCGGFRNQVHLLIVLLSLWGRGPELGEGGAWTPRRPSHTWDDTYFYPTLEVCQLLKSALGREPSKEETNIITKNKSWQQEILCFNLLRFYIAVLNRGCKFNGTQ